MFNANTIRIYTYNDNGDTVSFKDYEDTDFMKRLRLGAGFGFLKYLLL